MAERPAMSLPEAQALVERLKSIPADRATMMRETQAILALGDEVVRLAAELAVARESLLRMEWDRDTDARQCAWCLGHQSYGHHTGCPMAALLARLGGAS